MDHSLYVYINICIKLLKLRWLIFYLFHGPLRTRINVSCKGDCDMPKENVLRHQSLTNFFILLFSSRCYTNMSHLDNYTEK